MRIMGLLFLLADSRLLSELVLSKHLHHAQPFDVPWGCEPRGGADLFLDGRWIFPKLHPDPVIPAEPSPNSTMTQPKKHIWILDPRSLSVLHSHRILHSDPREASCRSPNPTVSVL